MQNSKLQRRIQRYGWDAGAEKYHANWSEKLTPVHKAMFEMARLNAGDKVFEIACGSGLATIQAAKIVGDCGEVYATDISAEMINLLESFLKEHGLNNTVTTRVGAEDEGICKPDQYDAALCSLGLMYFPEPELALRNMWQALKPGGRATSVVWGERKKCRWAELFPIVDEFVESDVCPLFFSLGSGDALTQLYKYQGFEQLQTLRIPGQLNFADKYELFDSFIYGGAVALAAKRFNKETRQKVELAFLDSVLEFSKGNTFSIPTEYVVVSGVK